jgi:general secretion pathway protein G
MVGIAILAVLLAILIPTYKSIVLKSKETILKDNLLAMRRTIEQYTKDTEQPPHSLQDLVVAGYFRQLPVDPITNSNSKWKPVIETVVVSPEKTDRGITDVHSGSALVSSNGTAYSTW